MNINIRLMTAGDRDAVLTMMRDFYDSDALLTTPADDVLVNDFAECTGDSPYATGYIIEADGEIAGFGMAAHSYSTEFGGRCLWLEDLYFKPEYRGRGLGTAYFKFIESEYADKVAVIRLEVEHDNEGAIRNYTRNGYTELPYLEMVRPCRGQEI